MVGAVGDDLGHFFLADALVVEDAALGPQHPQLPFPEGVAGAAQLGQLADDRAQPVLVAVPEVEAPVEGVAVALHGDLVAVVDAGHPRQGEDDGVGHLEQDQPFLIGFAGDAAAALPGAAPAVRRLVGNDGHGPLGVVGGQKVQRGVQGGGGVVVADGQDLVHGVLGGPAPDKVQHRILEGVVHDAVQPLAQQVGAPLAKAVLGGGVLPHLADQQFVLPVGLDGGADLLDEAVGQLVGHIQPEARSPAVQPGVDDAALPGDERHIGGVLLVDLGQGLEAPPAAVPALVPGGKVVPAAVRRVLVPPGAAAAVPALPVEVEAVRTGVAEHPVQNDADAEAGGLPAQLLKIVVGAQQGVHVHIVGGVVAVVGVGLKDGVQVEVGHTQLMQVGQFELDALQVPAEIIVV